MNIRKGDAVMVIAGKDKGKSGVVVKAMPDDNKVVVDGLNIALKTKKPRTAQDRAEIMKISAPMDASNVMPVCGECGAATRVGHKIEEKDGKKVNVRVCKKCGAVLESASAGKTKAAAKKAAKKKPAKKAEQSAEE